jgi:hypothetical protein
VRSEAAKHRQAVAQVVEHLGVPLGGLIASTPASGPPPPGASPGSSPP